MMTPLTIPFHAIDYYKFKPGCKVVWGPTVAVVVARETIRAVGK